MTKNIEKYNFLCLCYEVHIIYFYHWLSAYCAARKKLRHNSGKLCSTTRSGDFGDVQESGGSVEHTFVFYQCDRLAGGHCRRIDGVRMYHPKYSRKPVLAGGKGRDRRGVRPR